MKRFIFMHCGYAESATVASLIYSCDYLSERVGFESIKEAITELALDMYAKFYDDVLSVYEQRYSRKMKDCCRKALIANKDANFCSACGDQIKDKDFDYEGFMHYVSQLHSATTDSYGSAEDTTTRPLVWWPYWSQDFLGAPREEIIYIAENAEVVLLAALLEAKPELRTQVEQDWSREWNDYFRLEKEPSYR